MLSRLLHRAHCFKYGVHHRNSSRLCHEVILSSRIQLPRTRSYTDHIPSRLFSTSRSQKLVHLLTSPWPRPSEDSDDANSRAGPSSMGNTPFWILLVTSAGVLLYATRLVTQYQPLQIDESTFFRLLERGEVSSVVLHERRPYAFVELLNVYVGTDKKVVIVPLQSPPDTFEKHIRQQETIWGIPENDRLPVAYGDPRQVITDSPSPLRLMFFGIVLSTLLTTTFLLWGIKRGDISNRTVLTRSFRPLGQKKTNATPTTEAQGAERSNKPADDRYTGGMPSFWDPFSGMQTIKPVTTNVKFKDVAGLHASKDEVMEFVSYLKKPQKFQMLGAKLPKGALLLGPPGTGKTLLVKALANEAGVPFFSMAGSEFVEVIGGLGASRIRQLFRTARSNPPAIIFIDELDSLGRRRSSDSGSPRGPQGGGVSEMEQTLNQLLVEMDGMDTAEGTIVFAATNRADLLDKALLRAGRFDRHIFIDLPNLAERKELLNMYMAKYKLSPDLVQDLLVDRLSTWTPGMSGADIARLCNEAALIAARRENSVEGVVEEDFEAAFERILAGAAKKSNPLSPADRRVAAVQEGGRALVAWLLPRTRMVPVKVSIIPRTTAGMGGTGGLGFTHIVPEERRLFDTEELCDRMTVLLGGRAAEQIMFNRVSDASQRYLTAAHDLAFKQVREWGMSKVIGNLSFENDPSGNEFNLKPYSQHTQQMMELEAEQLVTSAFNRCVQLLESNKTRLQSVIDRLLEKETLSYDELVRACESQSESKI